MKLIKSHKIRIYPNQEQEILLKKSCGVARLTYNWGLAEWDKQYKEGKKPTELKLKKEFNEIKREKFPFIIEVTKCSPEYAFVNLGEAFKRFFKKKAKYPKFKRKKLGLGSFSISNDKFKIEEYKVQLPKIGWIKMSELLRLDGKIMKGTVSNKAGRWFISISVEFEVPEKQRDKSKKVGIDVGIKDTLVLSTGEKFNQIDLTKEIKKVKKEQRKLSKKVKGSNNFRKQVLRLQLAWLRYTDKKEDWVNKITTQISKRFDTCVVEDLNISGMMKNKNLAPSFQKISLSGIMDKLKEKMYVVEANRFFPSSKLCHKCGFKNENLTLKDRFWVCPNCGVELDRDVNAAKNLVGWATSDFKSVDTFVNAAFSKLKLSNKVVEAEKNLCYVL